MTRTLTTAVADELAREGRERVHFLELDFAAVALRVNSSAGLLSWANVKWHGVGGVFGFRAIEESGETGGHGLEVVLSGLDPTILDSVLAEQYLGRRGTLWRGYFHHATKQIVGDPVLVYRGDMSGGFDVRLTPSAARQPPGTAEVTVTLRSRLDRLNQTNGFQTNESSHQTVFAGDQFFKFVGYESLRPVVWKV